MTGKKILYISGSIGLGHVSKDLAIARKLRELNPAVAITWLAAHPADLVLEKSGETLHPLSERMASYSAIAEGASRGGQLNLVDYVVSSFGGWVRNVKTLREILKNEAYDLVVGNETYEIVIGLVFKLFRLEVPFVIIYDFLGLDMTTGKPLERIGNYILNWVWSRDRTFLSDEDKHALFVGVPEDVPYERFGFLLPSRRDYARAQYQFIGYIVLFDPQDTAGKKRLRGELGYGVEPLIVCSIGGTSIGKALLELCGQSYEILKEQLPGLQMVLVAGPRLAPDSIDAPPGVTVRGYVPELFRHYAASDLAIVQGGFSSTLELAALRRPFIFFPIKGHSEQETVAERLGRFGAGVRMNFSETSPADLAQAVIDNLGAELSYRPVPVDGAMCGAQAIDGILQRAVRDERNAYSPRSNA